jgi:hypothetical protein
MVVADPVIPDSSTVSAADHHQWWCENATKGHPRQAHPRVPTPLVSYFQLQISLALRRLREESALDQCGQR